MYDVQGIGVLAQSRFVLEASSMRLIPLLLALLVPITFTHHVLFVHNFGTKSHLILMKPLAEELLNRGHKVSSIFFKSIGLKHENYTEMVIPSQFDAVMGELSKKTMAKGMSEYNPLLWIWAIGFYKEKMEDLALDPFRSKEVIEFLRRKPKVDAMVNMQPGNSIFAELLNCPIVQFSGVSPIPWIATGTTNVINHSIQPYVIAPHIEPMSFVQRIQNHLLNLVTDLWMDWFFDGMFPYQRDFIRKEFDFEISHHTTTLKERCALLLACCHPITHGAWQYTPNIIEVIFTFVTCMPLDHIPSCMTSKITDMTIPDLSLNTVTM